MASKFSLTFRCVDEYYVYVWKKSSPKETAIKIPVGVKNAVSHTVDVEGNSPKVQCVSGI
jgi:hypothetical protein